MNIIPLLLFFSLLHAQKGVVLKPVIDLVGHPLASEKISYHNLPCAGGSQETFQSCPRAHQLLYNEAIEIIQQTETEVCVKVPHLFYVTADNDKPQSTFWTQKENIIPFCQLSKQALSCIPEPYSFEKRTTVLPNIILLTKPWYNKTVRYTFSVGTRFICSSNDNNKKYFTVCAVCPKTLQPITLTVPRSDAMLTENIDRQKARAQCVKLLKSWAHMGTVPYIWGGCSLTETVRSDQFKESFFRCNNKLYSAYEYNHMKTQPTSGFDCTGLMLRAAQAAGLPYYYKNSTTIARYLKSITSPSEIQEGDLIWIPGHIMVIADLKKSTIIEARHYNDGYGKVQEIKLNRLFKDIQTFSDLFNTIAQHKPLFRLNRKGAVSKTIMHAKILSLDSCYF